MIAPDPTDLGQVRRVSEQSIPCRATDLGHHFRRRARCTSHDPTVTPTVTSHGCQQPLRHPRRQPRPPAAACRCLRGRRAQQGDFYAPVAVRLSRSAALAGRLARHHGDGDGDRAANRLFFLFRRLRGPARGQSAPHARVHTTRRLSRGLGGRGPRASTATRELKGIFIRSQRRRCMPACVAHLYTSPLFFAISQTSSFSFFFLFHGLATWHLCYRGKLPATYATRAGRACVRERTWSTSRVLGVSQLFFTRPVSRETAL
jgi:hypothetical protein